MMPVGKAVRSLFLTLLLIMACARIEAPPGGPVDKTGPSVLATSPQSGNVNVPAGNQVSLEFSENVDHRSTESAISVAPRPKGKIKYRWHGRTLNLVFPESFSPGTTYIINAGTSIADWRNNKMDSSFILAFSTGDSIDQGKISGIVMLSGKPLSGTSVGLYDTSLTHITRFPDSLYPPFLTQSGKNGDYILGYLPRGFYLPLAFVDRNKNQFFDYPDETYGVPDRIVRVGADTTAPAVNFNLIMTDTSAVSIISATLSPDRLIRVRFARVVPTEPLLNDLDKVSLILDEDRARIQHPLAFRESRLDTASIFNFYFGSLSDGSYLIRFDSTLFGHTGDGAKNIEAPLAVKLEKETSPPELAEISHRGKIVFPSDSVVTILFSEPIDKKLTSDSLMSFIISDSLAIPFIMRWPDPFRLDCYLSGLNWGQLCQVRLNPRYLYDLAGNHGPDTVFTCKFDTYNYDSLGSVTGHVTYESDIDSSGAVMLVFRAVAGNPIFDRIVPDHSFNFQLPPGKYLLSGYLDRNDNGRLDYGSLIPFRLSETSAVFPDTVRIRARFETSGIQFLFK